MRLAYDKQEVIELLRYLQDSGFIERRVIPGKNIVCEGILHPDEQEEKAIFWFLGSKHWYQV